MSSPKPNSFAGRPDFRHSVMRRSPVCVRSYSARKLLFAASSHSTRSTFRVGCAPAMIASSSAFRASFRYCSNWSLEKYSPEPTVSNVPTLSSIGRSLGFTSTSSRSRIVFTYSRRFSRRIVMLPPVSDSALRATTICLESASRKASFSSGFGCFSSSGGISPELIAPRIFCHRSAVGMSAMTNGMSSSRVFPFCFSALWQETQ